MGWGWGGGKKKTILKINSSLIPAFFQSPVALPCRSPERRDLPAARQPVLHLFLGVAQVPKQDLLLDDVEELREEGGVFLTQLLLCHQVIKDIQG